jgi:hypothetical protein
MSTTSRQFLDCSYIVDYKVRFFSSTKCGGGGGEEVPMRGGSGWVLNGNSMVFHTIVKW